MVEVRLPNLSIIDGQLRIPVSKKGGGFTFDGSSVVIDLEVTDTEAAATQDPPTATNGKRKNKDDDPKQNPATPPPLPSNITNPNGKGA